MIVPEDDDPLGLGRFRAAKLAREYAFYSQTISPEFDHYFAVAWFVLRKLQEAEGRPAARKMTGADIGWPPMQTRAG
jgi:hypothetical protein